MYDALTDYKNDQNFYSIIDETPMTIQGRALPFNDNDVVPMGIKIPSSGLYTIAIGALEGLFINQDIFVKDKMLNIIHDLKEAPYTFNSNDGISNDRFEIIYKNNALGNHEILDENSILIFGHNEIITVKSSNEQIKEIDIFDILGRRIYTNQKINQNEFHISNLQLKNQSLIVRVRLENGQLLSKIIIW